MKEHILEKVATFQNQGSGWQFDEVVSFYIYIDPFEPGVRSSYLSLPEELANKSIINPKNTENDECYKWSITIAEYMPKVHPERVNKKLRDNYMNFNWDGRVPYTFGSD